MTKDALLGSETATRVLALLASLAGDELHTNELVRRTGSNPNAVQRAITGLERTGLLQSRRVGNLRLWRMDPKHPLYRSVRDVTVRTRGLPLPLAQILGQDAGIAFAFLFGSYVSAQDDASSDIDMFVVGPADWGVIAQAIGAASRAVGRELRPVVWSLHDLGRPTPAQSTFLTSVLTGPVIWVIGDRDGFERHRHVVEAVARGRTANERESRVGQASRRGSTRERRSSKESAR